MATRKNTAPAEAQSRPIPEPLFRRLLESISLLEVYNRSLDDEHASEQMALQAVIRELHAVYDELDGLNLPTPAERLRMIKAMPASWFVSPAARKQSIAEARADIAAERSLQ